MDHPRLPASFWPCKSCGKDKNEHRIVPKGGDNVFVECPPLQPLAEGDAWVTGDWRGWTEQQRADAVQRAKLYGDVPGTPWYRPR